MAKASQNTKIVSLEHILQVGEQMLGIVTPSTVWSMTDAGSFIWGPKGIVKLLDQSTESLIAGLEAAGSLVSGSDESIHKMNTLLQTPLTSRTASYFACTGRTCDEINSMFENLVSKRVLIIGCGGIGSSTTLLLAGVGIRNFLLVDGDQIEESNLNRQLFWSLKDIGDLKVNVLKSQILARFVDASVEIISKHMSIDEVLDLAATCDGVVITADEPASFASMAPKIAADNKIHVVAGGYCHQNAMALYFHPNVDISEIDAQYESTENDIPTDIRWSRLPHSIMPSYGPTNFMLASILSSNLVAGLSGQLQTSSISSTTSWDSTKFPTEFTVVSHPPKPN